MQKIKIHQRKFALKKGFSLIELIAVIVILGLLATVVVVNVAPFLSRSYFEKVRSDIAQLENALELYRFNESTYPTTDQGLEALIKAPQNLKRPSLYPEGGYIKRLPKDPWGNNYLYLKPGIYSKYDIFTYGADGLEGGSGDQADIGNWNLEK